MSTKKIKIAPGLELPAAELATSVTALLGIRGSGKSNLAAVIAEGLLDAGIPVIILDRVGIWASLRLAPDGKTPSRFAIPILGGEHGDVAILPGAGRQVAEALAKGHSSAVIDISRFSKGGRITFATDFAEAFFEQKKRCPGPVCLVLEEAQRYIPQAMRFSDPGLARCLGAFEEVAEQGRNYGVGLLLISLRPEKLNKDVLNLSENVFALRMLGVHERKAVAEWVQEHEVAGRDDVKNELPSLPRGHVIFWSPAMFSIYGKFHVRLKSTYDAGRTPDSVRAGVKIEPLDLGVLKQAMEAVVQEAAAADPRVLRARVATLEKELQVARSLSASPATAAAAARSLREDAEIQDRVAILRELNSSLFEDVTHFAESVTHFAQNLELLDDLQETATKIARVQKQLDTCLATPAARGTETRCPSPRKTGTTVHTPARERGRTSQVGCQPDAGPGPTGGLRRMMVALAQRPQGLTDAQMGVRAVMSSKSGTFTTYLATARKNGWIVDHGKTRSITERGVAVLGDYERLPEGRALLDHWVRQLGQGGTSRMLRALENAYPNSLTYEQLAKDAQMESSTSGTFTTYVSHLIKLELVKRTGRRELAMSEELE